MITNKRQLLEYCLRRLGAPVIQINVDEQQCFDRIDDAIQKFQAFHESGSVRKYILHEITERDIQKRSITADRNVISVTRIFSFSMLAASYGLEYQSFMTDLIGNIRTSNTVTGYVIGQQHINLIENIFNREPILRFNQYLSEIQIDTNWAKYSVGDVVMLEAYYGVDPERDYKAWDDPWLKDYTTALIKKQWGSNLLKYRGFSLPSGVTISGETFYNDAVNEIAQLEDQLQTTYQTPLDIAIG
jgi:hypothetical protein